MSSIYVQHHSWNKIKMKNILFNDLWFTAILKFSWKIPGIWIFLECSQQITRNWVPCTTEICFTVLWPRNFKIKTLWLFFIVKVAEGSSQASILAAGDLLPIESTPWILLQDCEVCSRLHMDFSLQSCVQLFFLRRTQLTGLKANPLPMQPA